MSEDPGFLRTEEFRRILLVKLSAVGDVVHTIPVLNALRRRYPAARIDWLLKPSIAELIRHHPAVSNILHFDDRQWARPWRSNWSALGDIARLVTALRANRYDLVVDLHGQFRTALMTLATRAPVRIGFDRPRREVWEALDRDLPKAALQHGWKGAREASWIAYTHRIRLTTLDMHAVDRYLLVGSMLGFEERPADFSFPIPPEAVTEVDRLLGAEGLRLGPDDAGWPVVLAPGTLWETKHWQTDGFAGVARHFLKRGRPVVLIGSGRDRARCAEVAARAPGAIDLSGRTTLTGLAALIARSAVCVTNDSGPMHMAVALRRPVVSVFGPTDSVWIGPYRRPRGVLQADLPCAPCYFRQLKRCPHDHACMRAISTEAVIARVEEFLGDVSPGSGEPFRNPIERHFASIV